MPEKKTVEAARRDKHEEAYQKQDAQKVETTGNR
jgi:hypothetical protein